MKVCFFGLGSIGKRHVANLSRVCENRNIPLEIDAYRSTSSTLPDSVSSHISVKNELAQLKTYYDAIFITNPTKLHFETLQSHLHRSDFFFIEKPVFELPMQIQLPTSKMVYVACPLRYSGVVFRLKELLKTEKIYSVCATCSSYLPDWRTDVDYRTTYSAKTELGGGVHIDLIHELDLMCHLFGEPESINIAKGRYSDLEIDSIDAAAYQLLYSDKLILIYLDYFGVSPERSIVLRGKNITIHANFLQNSIEIKRLNEQDEKITWEEGPNEKYIREIECFIDYMADKRHNPNDMDIANKTLSFALGEID